MSRLPERTAVKVLAAGSRSRSRHFSSSKVISLSYVEPNAAGARAGGEVSANRALQVTLCANHKVHKMRPVGGTG